MISDQGRLTEIDLNGNRDDAVITYREAAAGIAAAALQVSKSFYHLITTVFIFPVQRRSVVPTARCVHLYRRTEREGSEYTGERRGKALSIRANGEGRR